MPSLLGRRQLSLPLLALLLVACGGPIVPTVSAPPSVAPSAQTGGVVAAPIAAATVLQADPRFSDGFMPLNPLLVQQRWYEMTGDGSSWTVSLTVGWGDCRTSCPHQHTWHYRVGPDGAAVFLDEAGESLPTDTFPSPASGVAEIHLVTQLACSRTTSCLLVGLPGTSFEFSRFDANNTSFQLDADAEGGRHSSLPGGVYILTTLSRPDGGPLPAPFAMSLAPGQDNLVTITMDAGL